MQIKNGLIGLTCSDSFLSISIQFFMWLWNQRKYQGEIDTRSHAFMILAMPGKMGLQVCESNKWGPEIKEYGESGYRNNKNVIWMEPVVPWKKDELLNMALRMREFTDKITHYDHLNFLYQIHMICSPEMEWKGPTGKKAEKKIYCSELNAYLLNSSGRLFFAEPWSVNPEDIRHHPDLKIFSH